MISSCPDPAEPSLIAHSELVAPRVPRPAAKLQAEKYIVISQPLPYPWYTVFHETK
jgi:hypothetical protein